MFKTNHFSVLLSESIAGLNVKPGSVYIDCNLGGGGHTAQILKKGGKVIAFDLDQKAIEHCSEIFSTSLKNGDLKIFNNNFSELLKIVENLGLNQQISGVLYDLGLSTFQLKEEKKGFSFEDETQLDMRLGEQLGPRAEDLLKVLNVKQLADLFFKYGEEPQSKVFALAIKDFINARGFRSFNAKEVADVIKKASKYETSRIHPATRVFQALRIAVNNEFENLEKSLDQAVSVLKSVGRLVIISFHSLEDLIAKNLEACEDLLAVTTTPIVPSDDEIVENSSSRSAKMRIYEKI
jgi:16S rRNA (cytosine1402-N4)-methyltransferase